MRTVRIYSPEALKPGTRTELTGGPARHVNQVLRMQPGAMLTLFDGRGGEYPAQIVSSRRGRLVVDTGNHHPVERESALSVTMWPALCKRSRMDNIIQKATELGVAAIRPVHSERSQIKLDTARAARKLRHWQEVIISACEQCGRNRLPDIAGPTGLGDLLSTVATFDHAVLLDPAGAEPLGDSLRPQDRVLMLTGPEGGFSAEERRAAAAHGVRSVRFGPRVLRTETAPVAALAVLQWLAGDMGSGTPGSNSVG